MDQASQIQWVFHQGKSIVFVKSICILNTVYGRNPAPVEVGRFSHYLQGLMDVRLCRISAINSTTLSFSAWSNTAGWASLAVHFNSSIRWGNTGGGWRDWWIDGSRSFSFFQRIFPCKLANRHGRCSFHLPFLPSQMVDFPIPLC